MANFFQDNDDLAYYVERGIDWAPLVELVEHGFHSPDGFGSVDEAVSSYRDLLQAIGAFAAEEIAPAAGEIDKQGLILENGEVRLPPRLTKVMEQMRELGLFGLSTPRELGGLGCPTLMYFLTSELVGRADVSALTQFCFYDAVNQGMLLYSTLEGSTAVDPSTGAIIKTRWAAEVGEVVRGEACGSMDITEANAGSDMAALRTKAEQDADGQWYVTGEKIFITSGHGKFHFVVARTDTGESASGLKGLSLFLVPAYRTDAGGKRIRLAHVSRLEEKLGHHASPTCVVTFDHTPAQLVGERGQGFDLILRLMNGARINVGFEAVGLAESAYRSAKAYAAERQSMGKTLDRHEIIADYLDEARTDIQAIRALAVQAGYHEELALRLEAEIKLGCEPGSDRARALEQRLRRHRRESRRLTPLLKYVAAEKAVEIARRALQIHGGFGYTTEYPVGRLLRDGLALPIYEGTSQIQALMAMKDTLGAILSHPRQHVRRLAQARLRSLSALDSLERRVARLVCQSLSAELHLLSRTATQKLKALTHQPITTWPHAFFKQWDPKRDFAYALLHAERLTQVLADVAAAEILLAQARKHPDRREVCERHLERAEPRVRYLVEQITATGDRVIAQLRGNGREQPPATKSA